MKFKWWSIPLLPLVTIAATGHTQQTVNQTYSTVPVQTYSTVQGSTTQTQYSYPPVTYQNSITAPPVTNPASSLPGLPSAITYGLPGSPTSSQTVVPGNSTTPSGPSLLQSLYPQPAVPQPYPGNAPVPTPGPGLKFNPKPYESIAPPESYLPGIATIKDKQWVVSDFLYNLTSNIGIKVEVIKPEGKYIPLSERQLEQRIADIFLDYNIDPEPIQINCQPPLPMFYVLIMTYSCDKRIIGVISAQLYEQAKPLRIDMDLNGVWQTITWERQALVASADKDFNQEISETLTEMVRSFTERFKYYHPVDERDCFPKH